MPGIYDKTYSEWLAWMGVVHGPGTQSQYMDWLAEDPETDALVVGEPPGFAEYVTAAGQVVEEQLEKIPSPGETLALAIKTLIIGGAIVVGLVILTR